MKALAALAACGIILISGCVKNGPAYDALMSENEISLTVKGSEIMRYSPANHQIGYNSSEFEFRVHDDTFGNYFIIKLTRSPEGRSVGDKMTGDIIWTTFDNIKSRKSVDFKITRIEEGTGMLWLWNSKYKIAAVVRMLY